MCLSGAQNEWIFEWRQCIVRFTGISLSIVVTLVLSTNYYFFGKDLLYFHISSLLVILITLVWVGTRYDMLKELSEKDYLTNTYTRRYVYKRFPQISKKSEMMFVFLMDLNNFKMINDQFGHDAGDQVLRHVASILKATAHKTDIVARWGGDEFIILSRCSSKVYFKNFTSKLEEELKLFNQNKQLSVEFSIGKAIFPYEGKTLNDLIKIADKNMYKRKSAFRNNLQPNTLPEIEVPLANSK